LDDTQILVVYSNVFYLELEHFRLLVQAFPWQDVKLQMLQNNLNITNDTKRAEMKNQINLLTFQQTSSIIRNISLQYISITSWYDSVLTTP
jgi:hypothetical protein